MSKLSLVSMCLLGAGYAVAAPSSWDGILKPGMDYKLARERLLESGFRISPLGLLKTAPQCSASAEICSLFPEVDSCLPTGNGACNFRWVSPNGEALFVETSGENVESFKVEGAFAVPPALWNHLD